MKILGYLLIFGIIITILGFFTKWLWNALCPDLFHLPVITWGQAIGLLTLCNLLFVGTHANSKK